LYWITVRIRVRSFRAVRYPQGSHWVQTRGRGDVSQQLIAKARKGENAKEKDV
jgi:hypothetical protein